MTPNDDVHSTKSFFIDCNNGAGASFDHVALDGVTVSDILDPIYISNDVVYSFFPLNDVQNYQGVSKPLVAVKVTELVDGVFIGLSMNHSVADGTVFWLFFNTWSKISNDNENDVVLANTPHLVFDREQFSNGNVFPIRVPFNIPNHIIIEREMLKGTTGA
uniref:Uncharacterized protein n=1 Tax=Cannabis sativa TaxID=3483 RepID=A0A803PIS9_CANSA